MLKVEMNARDALFVSQIVTRNGVLTIGAPTSPFLTNAMMYTFDRAMAEFYHVNELVFTRFVSSRTYGKLDEAFAVIGVAANEFPHAKLAINRSKRVIYPEDFIEKLEDLSSLLRRKFRLEGRGKGRSRR
ncbi:hypothetical protein [Allopontixanthobacter sediminis]|uniref:hypothetical protein n=1 Tax=Allopontixanthobacter sediminis TaxID=1689985 RepID=UPI001368B5B6|nr:hypothetical protein [Allopontixanthobacter sediminis]